VDVGFYGQRAAERWIHQRGFFNLHPDGY